MEWEHHKHDNIMTFRDNTHPSLMTVNAQPSHHTVWLDALDDSAESFLG
jgi:trimethylamine monooxygenase